MMLQAYNNFTPSSNTGSQEILQSRTIVWDNATTYDSNRIPEPGTMALASLAFGGMVFARRRKPAVATPLIG